MTVANLPFWASDAAAEAADGLPVFLSDQYIRALAGVGTPYWASTLAGRSGPYSVAIAGNTNQSGNNPSFTMGQYGGIMSRGTASSWSWGISNVSGGTWTLTNQSTSTVSVTISQAPGGGQQISALLTVQAIFRGTGYSSSVTLYYTNNQNTNTQ